MILFLFHYSKIDLKKSILHIYNNNFNHNVTLKEEMALKIKELFVSGLEPNVVFTFFSGIISSGSLSDDLSVFIFFGQMIIIL